MAILKDLIVHGAARVMNTLFAKKVIADELEGNLRASDVVQDSTHRFIMDNCKTITDWNTATTNGFYMANGATNGPSSAWYFGRVLAHNPNYLYQEVYQFTATADARGVPKYIRSRVNGTWGAWQNVTVAKAVPIDAKFTDTVYSHPNSGATAGTYRSVTINAQGHVTGGTNPTTLSGYGITDAAAKTHTHNYAGSSSAGGPATSALKWSTARKVGNASFDGTGDITLSQIGAAATSHTHPKSQITDFPTSMPANGGTASYANYPVAHSIPANADLNTYTGIGFYKCGANATVATLKNCPTTSAFFLEVMFHAGSYQRLVEYTTGSPKVYFRNNYNGTWSSWFREYTTIDKPTASEIGAAAASHTHSYAPVSHTHTKSQITDFPTSLKNPNALTISLNGSSQGAYDGLTAKNINVTAASVGAAPLTATRTLTATATASGWSASAPYTQTINVSGITSSDNPVIGLSLPTDTTAANEKLIKKAYGCLSSAVTNNGSITLYCAGKKPVTNFTFFIKGI